MNLLDPATIDSFNKLLPSHTNSSRRVTQGHDVALAESSNNYLKDKILIHLYAFDKKSQNEAQKAWLGIDGERMSLID